jgi:hypothetical protein
MRTHPAGPQAREPRQLQLPQATWRGRGVGMQNWLRTGNVVRLLFAAVLVVIMQGALTPVGAQSTAPSAQPKPPASPTPSPTPTSTLQPSVSAAAAPGGGGGGGGAPAAPLVTTPAIPALTKATTLAIVGTAQAGTLVKVFLDATAMVGSTGPRRRRLVHSNSRQESPSSVSLCRSAATPPQPSW